MDAITDVPLPANEPIHEYAPGSGERTRLTEQLRALAQDPIDLPHVIGGRHTMGAGDRIDVVQPHRHHSVLGTLTNAGHDEAILDPPDTRRLTAGDSASQAASVLDVRGGGLGVRHSGLSASKTTETPGNPIASGEVVPWERRRFSPP